jgi:hypothetical protein
MELRMQIEMQLVVVAGDCMSLESSAIHASSVGISFHSNVKTELKSSE